MTEPPPGTLAAVQLSSVDVLVTAVAASPVGAVGTTVALDAPTPWICTADRFNWPEATKPKLVSPSWASWPFQAAGPIT